MNNEDGSILIGDIRIYPFMEEQHFIQLFKELLRRDNYSGVKMLNKPVLISGLFFWFTAVFKEDTLKGINLSNADKNLQNSYADWSNERNRLKRLSHDTWLEEQLGKPYEKTATAIIFKRSWGEVTSYTDMKGGGVEISLYYK
ncbi:hypothetical protein ACYSNR_00410 [Enterococcus sp. LJL128]